MANKLFGLTDKDVQRLKTMLNWFEKTSHNPIPRPRTRQRPIPRMAPKFWMCTGYVSTDADGAANNYGGYYTVKEIVFDATLFNRGESVPWTLSDTEETMFNIWEAGTGCLSQVPYTDCIFQGWQMLDDAGNAINVGFPIMTSCYTAQVQADQTGMNKGFYICKLCSTPDPYWNDSTFGGLTSIWQPSPGCVVWNLWECGTSGRMLQNQDLMVVFPIFTYGCFGLTSGHGARWMGIPIEAGTINLEITGARDEPEGALKDLLATLSAARIIKDSTTAS